MPLHLGAEISDLRSGCRGLVDGFSPSPYPLLSREAIVCGGGLRRTDGPRLTLKPLDDQAMLTEDRRAIAQQAYQEAPPHNRFDLVCGLSLP